MNDMEALYEEFRKLREEVEGLNLDELGAFRLREYRRRFESLQRRDHELQSATRVNPEIDNEECRQILNLGDRMWSELGNTMIPIVELIDVKMALGKEVASERIHIKELKEENLKTIKTLENQNKRFKKSVEGITDPELRSVFEERIHSDEEIIQRLKDLDARYTERINELAARLRIIALGGKLPELEDIRRDTEGLEPGEAEEEARRLAETPEEELPGVTPDEDEEPAMDGGLPGVTFEGDGVDPIVPTDGEPSDVPAPTDAPTDGPAIVPTPTIRPEEPAETPAETPAEEPAEEPVPALVDPVTPTEGEEPVPALVGDDTPAETPAEEPAEEPVPALVDGETPAETPVEETPVRGESRNPKTKLWAKIDKVLKAAKVFLLTAIAVHTGLIIGGATKNNVEPNTNTDTVEETETPEETQAPEETSQVTPETTPETTPEVTPTAPAEPVAPVAPVTPEPTPVTPEPTPTVTVGENDVVLAPGESVYDATTGVEVGYTGTASRETENGTTPQQNRELEHVTDNTVVVRQEQTQPDPVVTPLPRTGEEVTEEKARETMTQEEQTNLDQAIDEIDWDAFFNEGPTR